MKSILIKILAFFLTFNTLAQSEIDEVEMVNTYAVSWNATYRVPFTTKNLKTNYTYFFQNKDDILKKMFIDFNDFFEKMNSQEILTTKKSSDIQTKLMVEICFATKKKINVYFDENGNYYFNEKWRKRNDAFYYVLFKYLSNEIVSSKLLDQIKINVTDDFWHKD